MHSVGLLVLVLTLTLVSAHLPVMYPSNRDGQFVLSFLRSLRAKPSSKTVSVLFYVQFQFCNTCV